MGCGVSFQGDGRSLEGDNGDVCTVCGKLNAVELYTSKTVNFIVHFTQLLQFF